MPAQTGVAAGDVAGGGNLLGEAIGLLRVRHRADGIDDVLLEPRAPVLQPLVERFLRVGRSCDRENAAGRAVFTAVRMRISIAVSSRAPERLPFGGEPIGIREQIHGSCSSSSRRTAAGDLRPHFRAECRDRESAVVELIAGIADVVEVDAIDGVTPRDVRDDGLDVAAASGWIGDM